jgi:predicted DNA-binding transcriptional regulator AlpA
VDEQTLTRAVLRALGNGGTMEMAQSVVSFIQSQVPMVPPTDLVGLAEVALMTGRSKQTVCNWIGRGNQGFPEPIKHLAATKVWDREQVTVWMQGHPELIRMQTHGGAS